MAFVWVLDGFFSFNGDDICIYSNKYVNFPFSNILSFEDNYNEPGNHEYISKLHLISGHDIYLSLKS